MEYPLELQRFGITRRITIETGGFFSRSQLLIDGNPAPLGNRQGEFELPREDGSTITARVQGVLLDPVPLVVIDRQVIRAAEPFTLMQNLASALSFIMALSMSIAGLFQISDKQGDIKLMAFLCMSINLFMGVLLGFTSMIVNRRILRSEMSRSSQIFCVGALNIIVIIGFLVVFMLLVGILRLFAEMK